MLRRASKAAEALRESEERFRQIAENINEVFWMTSLDKNEMLYISPAYERIWGRSCAELVKSPRTWLDAVHPEDLERVRKAATTRQSMGEYDEEYRVIRPDGSERWIRDRAFPIRDADGHNYRIAGVAEDITESKLAEQEIRMLSQELEQRVQERTAQLEEAHTSLRSSEARLFQAQKLEAVGTLAGGVAHDFNNLLSAILGYCELIRQEAPEHPAVQTYVEEVFKAGQRASLLVKQLLTFSRRQRQDRRSVQLQPIVRETMQMLRATVPTTIQIVTNVGDESPNVLADPTQIHQALMNLCTNAAYAMRDKPGRLEVSLEAIRVDDALAARHANLKAAPHVRLSIADTGCGMDAETLKHIFDPFFTTKPTGEGTGLGLAVVHGIVRDHEGTIVVQSELGEGTCFQIYFPTAPAEPATPSTEQSEPASSAGRHILFVDDESAMITLADIILKRLGYQVTSFARPLDALEAFRADPGKFDLVITDLNMPRMTGVDLAREIFKLAPRTPLILISGYIGGADTDSARRFGIRELLAKPFTSQQLTEAIRCALAPEADTYLI